jgi:uncharacterized membrane protein
LSRHLHPLQAIFLSGALTLFVGVLCSDLTYSRSFEVQWKNFASWLIVGGLVTGSVALVWAIVDLVRLPRERGARRVFYVAALLAMWVVAFVNALVHAGDAWASMPTGLLLSGVVTVLAAIATALGFSNYRDRVSP